MPADIFVQMAAYRDPELIPTITDALNNAAHPERLHVCVAWQHGDEVSADIFASIRERCQLTVIDIPYQESKGACWARNQIQQRYAGEAYTLHLDSHHRFVPDWDTLCIEMLEGLRSSGVEKPLLTAYLPSYDPENDPAAREPDPWRLALDRFIPEGAIFFTPETIPDWQNRESPEPSRFFSAHFAFTLGTFVLEVPHNPEFYFHGEEITLAVRAFTHGYDLFHPHRLVAWHEYTRRGRVKHWDDHHSWGEANARTHDQCRQLFGMDEYRTRPEEVLAAQRAPYGLGSARTLEQYERFAGVCFRRRAVTQKVLDHLPPDVSDNLAISYDAFHDSCIPYFRHCLDVGYDAVPHDDYDHWIVAFKSDDDRELFRQDADEAEIAKMKADPDKYCKVWRQFITDELPTRWIIWPHSRAHGWGHPIARRI